MPPKTRASAKRARSPVSTKEANENTQTRSSKRAKKDAKDASTASVDESQAQEDVIASAEAAPATSKTKKTKSKAPAPGPPSFHGNFDLYAMSTSSLNSIFAPKRDYAALLAALRADQAKPSNSGQVFLPAPTDPESETFPDGQLRSSEIPDPIARCPWDIVLESVEPADIDSFAALEDEVSENAFYAEKVRDTSAVVASPALEGGMARKLYDGSSASGTFEMRRAWVGRDGRDEVFEGFLCVEIEYSRKNRYKRPENGFEVKMPFWAIRARVGEDGEELELGAEGREPLDDRCYPCFGFEF